MNGTSYTTDSNGMYELTVPNYESFSITAKYADYNDKTATITVEGTDKTATITLDPIMHNLTVNVKQMYTNNNISGASVNIVINGQTVGRTATTDNDGNVTFEVRQNRTYKLKVTKSNFIASEEYTIPGQTSDNTFNVVLKNNPITITFTVKSEERSPYDRVSGATVRISGDDAVYTTNSSGQVSAQIDPFKEYTFTATLPTSSTAYPNDEYTTRTLTLTDTFYDPYTSPVSRIFNFEATKYNINVTVKDENGAVISGQPVKINDMTVNTNANGVATVNVRGKKIYLVSVSRDGYNPVVNETINLGTSDFNKTINLTLATITLTVIVKNNSGNLMQGVTFTVKDVAANTVHVINTGTGTDGKQELTLKCGKEYKITAKKSGYADNEFSYTAGTITSTDTKEIVMQLANHIKGKVISTRTNEGISGVTVTINNTTYTAETDENGDYDIKGVPGGTYSFTFTKTGYQTDTTSITNVTILDGQDKTNATVSLSPVLSANQYEFHLSWDVSTDLDAHVNGTFVDPETNERDYYEVYYSHKNESFGGSSASLDTDVQSGYSNNENITVTLFEGSAYFFVVNYNHSTATFRWTLKGGNGINRGGSYTFRGTGTDENRETVGICNIYNMNGSSGINWYA